VLAGLTVSGDLETVSALGRAAAALAAWAWIADARRLRRADLDTVGWVPWTAVFFVALLVAVVAFGFAAREWLAG
jgi:hypothetical protein